MIFVMWVFLCTAACGILRRGGRKWTWPMGRVSWTMQLISSAVANSHCKTQFASRIVLIIIN